MQTLAQSFTICVDNTVCVGRDDARVLGELAVDELRCEANVADLAANVVGSECELDFAISIAQHPVQFEHALARHDDLLLARDPLVQRGFTHRQAMPVGCDRTNTPTFGFQHQPV